MNNRVENKILCQSSLQEYFLNRLFEINQRSDRPLPAEVLFYSSQVLDTFSDPENIFEIKEGKKNIKVLGLKFLESEKLSKNKRKKSLMDIGDTALIICGFFHESLNRKLFQIKYYHDLGKKAYAGLDNLSKKSNRKSSVFGMMARSFDHIADMITVLSKTSFESGDRMTESIYYIINDSTKLKAS